MDRADILSGGAFKAVLRSALVFLAVLALMAVFSLRLIDRAMTEQVRMRVQEMAESIRNGDEDDLVNDLAQRVDVITKGAAGQALAYAVFDSSGTRVAGNMNVRPEIGEWLEAPVTLEVPPHLSAAPVEQRFVLLAVPVDDLTLVVGRSARFVDAAKHSAIRGFALTGFIVVLAMLAIGYLFSRKSQSGLERMEAVLDRVSRGETGQRIELSGENDQIDRVARRINAHLDQLQDLVGQTRRTAASVAHDLRRPLARATLGIERALATAEGGGDVRDEIEQSLLELERLQSLISSILRIARIESGDVGSMESFDLREVLDDVAEMFGPVAEDAAQHLSYGRAEQPTLLHGDREMLAQLVVNLVQNAITHAGAGATIRLAAREADSAVELSVTDDGPGIPEALRGRVFEPFFRTDGARTLDGNGLGLPLVRAIAERHGAALALDDANPGLRVLVRLPRRAGS